MWPTKIEFQRELRNIFETLQELNDIHTMSQRITDTVQQSATSIVKAFSKPIQWGWSSPTRAFTTKRWWKTATIMKFDKICKTTKQKAKENIMTYNQQIIRETIMADESQKNTDTDYTPRQAVVINPWSWRDHRTNGILHRAIRQWTEYHNPH